MEPCIHFRTAACKHLHLSIGTTAGFRDIVGIINELDLPGSPIDIELVRVSVLELVANSLRASHERGTATPISVDFLAEPPGMEIRVEDRGGGFAPDLLPYRLDEPPESIDVMGMKFLEYRARHDNHRFGMGLLLTRKTFNGFTLGFVSREGEPVPWFSGRCAGTSVSLVIDYASRRGATARKER